MKPSLSPQKLVAVMESRQLAVSDRDQAADMLSQIGYYRLAGYARYFQKDPEYGDDNFREGVELDQILNIYLMDEQFRNDLIPLLAKAEVLLRAHVAVVIGAGSNNAQDYLFDEYYREFSSDDPVLENIYRDLKRSKERHVLRYRSQEEGLGAFGDLPIWSAVQAFSFGTLSKVIERGADGSLGPSVADSLGLPRDGFSTRVRSLVYLRNRCAHLSRLWNHSVLDTASTPNNVRRKAKMVFGKYEPRSVLEVLVSLDDMLVRNKVTATELPRIKDTYASHPQFWQGVVHPISPRDHRDDYR